MTPPASKVDRILWEIGERDRVESRDPTPLDDREFDALRITKSEFIDAALEPRVEVVTTRPPADRHEAALKREQAQRDRLGADYVRLDEAASIAGVSPPTINRWARQGRIASIVVGGRKAYRRVDLEALAS